MKTTRADYKIGGIILRVIIYLIICFIFVSVSLMAGYGIYWLLEDDSQEADIKEVYSIECTFIANAESISDDNFSISSGEIASEQSLAENISVIFQHSEEIQSIIPEDYEYKVSCTDITSIMIFEIKGPDSEMCEGLAQEIMKVAPEVFDKYYEDGKLSVIDHSGARLVSREEAKTPHYYLNSLIFGLSLWVVFVFLVEYFLFRSNKKPKNFSKKNAFHN